VGDPRVKRFAALQDGTVDTIVDFHAKHLSKRPKLISIVGDSTKIDMDCLKAMGKMREISLDEIFVD
jgi:hypothetical protein